MIVANEIFNAKQIAFNIDYKIIFLEEVDFDRNGKQFEYYQNESHEFFTENDSHMVKCKLHINNGDSEPVFIEVNEVWDEEDLIPITNEEKIELEKLMINHITYI